MTELYNIINLETHKFADILQQLGHFGAVNFNKIIQICYWQKIALKK